VLAVAWAVLLALVGFLGAGAARRYALARALLDQPGLRRSHHVPTPRGGGAAIAAALLAAAVVLAWREPGQAPMLAGFGIGLALVALVGWVDDHRPLSAALRFAVQVAAAAVFAGGVAWQSGDPLAVAVAFVAPVVLANAWNFMDGIDGLAATQAVLVAGVPAVLAGGPGPALGLALAAATLGFLPWNFPRARLFLGDVGSGAIGFAVGALLALAVATAGPRALALALLPLSAFLLDTGLTLARRMRRGERWWEPHVTHAYQVAARRHGHIRVTLAFASWTAMGSVVAICIHDMAFTSVIISLTALYAAGAVAWWLVHRRIAGPGPAMEGGNDGVA